MNREREAPPPPPPPRQRLENLTVQSSTDHVVYGQREYGVNLVWSRPVQTGFSFERQSGSGPIKYGERIAIHVDGVQYLRYGQREYGINIVWSPSAVYDWHLESRSKADGAVVSSDDEDVAIYNESVEDYMVYGQRNHGINLIWAGDAPAPELVAGVSLGYRLPTTAFHCTGAAEFRLTPLSLTGGAGIDTAVTARTNDLQFAASDGYCTWTTQQWGLRAGTWLVDASTALWPNACQVLLSLGTHNTVRFTQGRTGCSTSPFTYP